MNLARLVLGLYWILSYSFNDMNIRYCSFAGDSSLGIILVQNSYFYACQTVLCVAFFLIVRCSFYA